MFNVLSTVNLVLDLMSACNVRKDSVLIHNCSAVIVYLRTAFSARITISIRVKFVRRASI